MKKSQLKQLIREEIKKLSSDRLLEEDDYPTDGYVEAMNADLQKGINLIQNAWDDWKSGPMTEPGMIKYAKEDLISYISNKLNLNN